MKKSTSFSIPLLFLLIGVVVGFLMAPAKKGFGNNTVYHYHFEPAKPERKP